MQIIILKLAMAEILTFLAYYKKTTKQNKNPRNDKVVQKKKYFTLRLIVQYFTFSLENV